MSEPSTRTQSAEPAIRRSELARFRVSNPTRSGAQLVVTLALFATGAGFALHAATRSPIAGILLGVVVSPLWVRLFVLQHDLGHGSLFKSRRLCHVLGSLMGVITLTPYFRWRKTHAAHHATSGNLDQRRPDRDIFTMTVAEYRTASRWRRTWYRAFRHPLALFGVVPLLVLVIEQRFAYGKGVKLREHLSTWFTNACWLGALVAFHFTVGIGTALIVILPMVTVAAGIGLWLFYVQHQFPAAYWRPRNRWVFEDASVLGSSFLDLPGPLRWVTADIGVHHVHHLDPSIPNYRLREAHESQAALSAVPRFRLADTWRATPVDLWDEATSRMVRFRDVARSVRADAPHAEPTQSTRAYRQRALGGLGRTRAARYPQTR